MSLHTFTHYPLYPSRQICHIKCLRQIPRTLVFHNIRQTTNTKSHHRRSAGWCLYDGLAESLFP